VAALVALRQAVGALPADAVILLSGGIDSAAANSQTATDPVTACRGDSVLKTIHTSRATRSPSAARMRLSVAEPGSSGPNT